MRARVCASSHSRPKFDRVHGHEVARDVHCWAVHRHWVDELLARTVLHSPPVLLQARLCLYGLATLPSRLYPLEGHSRGNLNLNSFCRKGLLQGETVMTSEQALRFTAEIYDLREIRSGPCFANQLERGLVPRQSCGIPDRIDWHKLWPS